jgi:hypothetical protein
MRKLHYLHIFIIVLKIVIMVQKNSVVPYDWIRIVNDANSDGLIKITFPLFSSNKFLVSKIVIKFQMNIQSYPDGFGPIELAVP